MISFRRLWQGLAVLLGAASASAAGLSLARPFGAHMVLPMDRPVPLWGTTAAHVEVTVTFGSLTVQAKSDEQGSWRLLLPPMPASTDSRKLVAVSGNETLALDDILVGRVWLCSGQSNMDFPLGRAVGGAAEAALAGNSPHIRLFNLTGAPTDARAYDAATLARLNPRDHFTGQWECASERSAAAFSAVAWWTGKLILQHDGIPVGLVENAVGGSGTEAWLPAETLASRRDYRDLCSSDWLGSETMSAWARGRAKQNLGTHLEASHPFKPGFLFESGVRSFAGFPFDGVFWYQGETNAESPDTAWNQRLITDLVAGWRTSLGAADLPFFIIQLPRIGGNDRLRKYWPQYRKAQANAVRALKATSLVVTEDLGWDSPDVHPPDKLPVAKRLADAVTRDLGKTDRHNP